MRVALFVRSVVILMAKLLGIGLVFLLERALGIPFLSCYCIILVAPNMKHPGWFFAYVIILSLFISSLLSFSWLWVCIGFFVILMIAQNVGRKNTHTFVVWLAVISSGVLFYFASGEFSLSTFLYWCSVLLGILIISRLRWLNIVQPQTWYIR